MDRFRREDYEYELPPQLIAQEGMEPRDAARLLVLRHDGILEHRQVRDVGEYLRPGDALVLNDTRVLRARLRGRRSSGGAVELLLLEQLGAGTWRILGRPARALHPGEELSFGEGRLTGRVLERAPDGVRVVEFRWEGSFAALLEEVGELPLPPYVRRQPADPERYQTVYARRDGSAAAPTAGLHFTPDLLGRLSGAGVRLVFVTLHVGLDTFRPVRERDIREHTMHTEFCELSSEAAGVLNEARRAGGRIVAVGTTTVRTLETAAGSDGVIRGFQGRTGLFIYPGYRFRAVDALWTNFHLPGSTLLMLVSAFGGYARVRAAYLEAVRRGYRFYSFGDAMLIL